MLYSQEVIEEVRRGNNIVDLVGSYVTLVQKGAYYFGLCPFHREKSASFSVSPDRQMYHCFGCGASGNVFTFLMQLENDTFLDAVKRLAERINYKLPEKPLSPAYKKNLALKEQLYELNKVAAKFFFDRLNAEEGAEARAYLDERKITQKARRHFGLGYAPSDRKSLYKHLMDLNTDLSLLEQSGLVKFDKNNSDRFSGRLMFPIIDVAGRIVGFGGRILAKGEPKYLNSSESLIFEKSHQLYGLNFAKKVRTREILLVEGYMDVISLHQAGFQNAVAALGTAFNQEHAKLLRQYANSVVLIFDGDEAGVKASLRAIPVLVSAGLYVKVLSLQNAKDPDEYIKNFGAEGFTEALKSAEYYPDFQINCLKKNYNLENTAERVAFSNEAAKILGALKNAIEQDAYIKKVALLSNISEAAIRKESSQYKPELLINEAAVNSNKFFQIQNTNQGNQGAADSTGNFEGLGGKNVHKIEEIGLIHAKRNILSIIANNGNIRKKIALILKPEEFLADPYIKLLQVIYESEKESIEQGELVSYFETIEEQNLIASTFTTVSKLSEPSKLEEASDEKTLQKMLTDWLRTIKTAYHKACLDTAMATGDANLIKRMMEYKAKEINGLQVIL